MINNISCVKSDVDYITTCSYNYINNSGKQLQMDIYNSDDKLIMSNDIPKGDTLCFELKAAGGVGPFHFDYPIGVGDSIYLNFSNERYLTYRKDYNDIFHWKAYKEIKVTNRKFLYFYEFTPEDYENAIVIE